MMTIASPRRRAGQRISSALWGVLVAGVGGLMIASYSGYTVDLELAAIIVLGAIGAWLLLSAAVSGIGRQREISRATAPTVEERAVPGDSPADHAPRDVADQSTDDTAVEHQSTDDTGPAEHVADRDHER